MCRERVRRRQEDQQMGNQMADFGSSALAQTHKSSSFLSIIGLSIGFSDKDQSVSSTPGFKFLSNLGNSFSFRSRKPSSRNGSSRIWDCGKGLSIINSFVDDEIKPFLEAFESSKSKNIVIGPRCKVYTPKSSSHFHEPLIYHAETCNLPQNSGICSHSPTVSPNSPNPQLGSSDAGLGIGEIPSHLLYSCKPSPSISVFTQNTNSSFTSSSPDNRVTILNSLPITSGSLDLDSPLSIKQSSGLDLIVGSVSGFVGSLSQSEMKLSEDYTCIISHGPNPKTTHIFGDYILDCYPDELSNLSNNNEERGEIELPHHVTNRSYVLTSYLSDEFLSFCSSCKNRLEQGKDIYMYRGEKAFCSTECRSKEIFLDEKMEKTWNISSIHSAESNICL